MNNTFGHIFSITTFGESHGTAVGVVVDGCPANIDIPLEKIQHMLNKRRPGQNSFVTPRNELDQIVCLSGLKNEKTLGTPICFLVFNKNQQPSDYSEIRQLFRPSHADYTTWGKYNISPISGGGRASARETIGRVASGALAKQVITHFYPGLSVLAYVDSVHNIKLSNFNEENITEQTIETSLIRCPDPRTSLKIESLIESMKKKGDSVGGTIKCIVKNCPVGLGEPVFDKLSAKLAQAMMSIPASKGFEIGSGFLSTSMYGSEHNDHFTSNHNKISTLTNHSGGIQGGISNGETITFRVAFKPPSTIKKKQRTVDRLGNKKTLEISKGRHDPCVLPRAVVIVESMTYLVICDLLLRDKIQKLK